MSQFSENNKANNGDEYDIENQSGREQKYKPRNPYTSYSKTEAIDKPLGFEQRVGNNTIFEDDLNNIRWREIDGKKYPPLRKTPTDFKYATGDKNRMMRAERDGLTFGGKKTRKKRSKKRTKTRRKKSYKKRGKK